MTLSSDSTIGLAWFLYVPIVIIGHLGTPHVKIHLFPCNFDPARPRSHAYIPPRMMMDLFLKRDSMYAIQNLQQLSWGLSFIIRIHSFGGENCLGTRLSGQKTNSRWRQRSWVSNHPFFAFVSLFYPYLPMYLPEEIINQLNSNCLKHDLSLTRLTQTWLDWKVNPNELFNCGTNCKKVTRSLHISPY